MIIKPAINWLFAALLCIGSLPALALQWPQQVNTSKGTLTVYQPQIEALKGDVISGRSAMSFLDKENEQVFGVFWFSANISTDRSNDTATVYNIQVEDVRWPDVNDQQASVFTDTVQASLKATRFDSSMTALNASLANVQLEQQSLEGINNDAPKVVFEYSLSVLLMFDGDPKFHPIENSNYERALNTPMAVARNTNTQVVYLTDGTHWYQSPDALGPYQSVPEPPADLKALMPEGQGPKEQNTKVPKIVVATSPTELISTDGQPKWQSLDGGKLLYVENTETPWLRDVDQGYMYILLSGRWYKSTKLEGPWDFVRADKLPESFANIAPDSAIGELRASVAGTDEANDAVRDAQVPQTAAISRKEATFAIEYDGDPVFKPISGTKIEYAVNTASQVLRINNHYYAVDNAVWFESKAALGPWQVADYVPEDEIAKIPPDSPMYNLTHVHIYDSDPEVVYVGYTPGYLWSFPYYGAPIYGTGWYYPPYWGGMYYPRPPTWGLHVGYNPWTGWTFGVSWSNGFFNFSYVWNKGWPGNYRPLPGWYGGGYRRPVIINTGDINIGNRVNIGNQVNVNNIRNRVSNTNVYKRTQVKNRIAANPKLSDTLQSAAARGDIKNNVFADGKGNILQNTDAQQWQERVQGGWQNLDTGRQQQLKDSVNQKFPDAKQNIQNRSNISTGQMQTRPNFQQQDFQRLNNAARARQRMSTGPARMPIRQRH